MSQGMFSSIDLKDANFNRLSSMFQNRPLVVTTDVGKEEIYAALANPEGEVEEILRWSNPDQLEEFCTLVEALGASEVTVVMEPTGTYQQPLRHWGNELGWDVRLLPTNRVKQARELYDGVPSIHDPKSTWVIAKLHSDGMSRPWGPDGVGRRELRAAVDMMGYFEEDRRRYMSRLEKPLSRFWPEMLTLLKLNSATLLEVLSTFGSPAQMAREPERARRVMKEASNGLLRPEKIERIIQSAQETVGEPMVEAERKKLKGLANHLDRVRRNKRLWKKELEDRIDDYEGAREVSEVVGQATAGVFETKVGDFRDFDSPAALLKKFGLNLKEKSSGKHQGQLRISKRGPAQARSFLYWATLRMIRENPVFRAWHQNKIERDGGVKLKSVVALMRKLVKGLWHVSRGEPFDATVLFDVERLNLAGC